MNRIHTICRLLKYGSAGRRAASPLILLFHVTTRCDMRCQHCGDDIWGDPRDDLSFAEIEKFSRGLGRVMDLGLGGGEPFLRDDLVDICELFVRQNGVQSLGIPSNGFATDRICSQVERILERCPDANLNIMPSLDGFRTTHDEIRRPGSFDRVMETARRLAEMRDRHQRLGFYFNATINSTNWQELPGLARYVQEEFSAPLDFNVLTGNPRDGDLSAPSVEELEKTVDGIYAARQESSLTEAWIRVCRDAIIRTNAEGRQVVPCRAGSLIATVHADGDVRVCPYQPALGNLRDRSFQEIWHGEEVRRQHQSISRGECACNSDCFVVSSLNNYWKLPFLMLQERLRIRRDHHAGLA